ncbi:MAG: hypothetical protein HY094_08200 [Candidatus Melainabacteria bacterium]|nr:hypothetical protein [Candidatus Melainabacteria bacterium]
MFNLILKKTILVNEYQKASFLFVLVALIFLFPAFLGKVDTPIDIRDMKMFPWRYYNVSEKTIKTTLWEGSFQQGKQTIDKKTLSLKIAPNKSIKLENEINLDEELANKTGGIKNSNYFISFEDRQVVDESSSITTSLFVLINKNTGETFYPPHSYVYLDVDKKHSWVKNKFYLNPLISKLKSVSDLNQYSLQVIFTNKSNTEQAFLYLRDFKLQCNNYSNVSKVHNYYNSDLIQEFTPYREYFSDSLKSRKIHFWNPYILTGAEFQAEPQLNYLYPIYFLSYLLFDHFTADLVVTFLFFALCGIGAFALARYWGLGFAASLFTGIVYMFHPFNATRFSYEYMLMISATLPFLLLFYEKNLNENKLLNKNLIISSFFLGLIFSSGHLQYVEYTTLFFLMFACFRLFLSIFSPNPRILKNVVSICFVSFFAISIGSSVIIPFFQLFYNSNRVPISDTIIKFQSISFKNLLGLIYPYYGGNPTWSFVSIPAADPAYIYYRLNFYKHYIYFGFLPFLLSILTLKVFFKNKLISFFYTTITLSMLICMGSPLFFLIKNLIPGFNEMQHIKFLNVYSYCVPFLSGIGFQIFIDYISRFKKNMRAFLVTTVILVTTVDLMYFSSFFVTWSDRSSYKPVPKGGSLEFILNEQKKSKEPFRVLSYIRQDPYEKLRNIQMPEPNTLMPYRIETLSGYSSFVQNDIFNLLSYLKIKDLNKIYRRNILNAFENSNEMYPINCANSKILDLLNVRFILTPKYLNLKTNNLKRVYHGDCSIYENLNYYPRAFVVSGYKVIDSPKDTIVELDNKDFNPKQAVILMSLPIDYKDLSSNDILEQPSDINYKVELVKYEPDQITLKVDLDKSGFLVLGNNLNSNWKVKINNRKGNHYQANLVQRAVYLPGAGSYLIEFYYFPKFFIIGFSITSFAVLILLLLLFFLKFNKSKIKNNKTVVISDDSLIKKENILVRH